MTSKRFENFHCFYLNKSPSGSCEWLSKIAGDPRLTYNEAGLLFLLGEKLINSAFGFEQVLNMQDCKFAFQLLIDKKTILCSLFRLIDFGYMTEEYFKEKNIEAITEYWDYILHKDIGQEECNAKEETKT